MAVSPCAQQPRPCTGPGDCAACGAGWSCVNGRCAAGGGQVSPNQVQQVAPNNPAAGQQAGGQSQQFAAQNQNPVNPLQCRSDTDCDGRAPLNFTCNNRNLEAYCDTSASRCSCRTPRSTAQCADGRDTTGCADCGAGKTAVCNGTACGCTPDTTVQCNPGPACPNGISDCAGMTDCDPPKIKTCAAGCCVCQSPSTVTPNCRQDHECQTINPCTSPQVARCDGGTCKCETPGRSCTDDDGCPAAACPGENEHPKCRPGGTCGCETRVPPQAQCNDANVATACAQHQCPPSGGDTSLTVKYCNEGNCDCKAPGTQTGTEKSEGDSCGQGDTCTCTDQTKVGACTDGTCTCSEPSTETATVGANCRGAGKGHTWCATIDCSSVGATSTGVCNASGVCQCTEEPEVVNPRAIVCTNDAGCTQMAGCDGTRQRKKCLADPADSSRKICQCQTVQEPKVTEGSACGGSTGVDCSSVTCTGAKRPTCRPSDNTCRCVDVGGSCTNDAGCPEGTKCGSGGRCELIVSGTINRPPFPEIEVPEGPKPTHVDPFNVDPNIETTLPTGETIGTGAPCENNGECPDGYMCVNGRCRPDPNITVSQEDLEKDPSYKFRLREGLKSVGANMNAAGMAASGDAMRAFNSFAQEYASGEWQKAYQRKVDRYERLSEKEKEDWRRKVDNYNRKLNAVLIENKLDAENFQRALAAYSTNRATALANWGMDMQSFTAMLQSIKTKLEMNDQQWGQWLAVWITEQDTLRAILGLTSGSS